MTERIADFKRYASGMLAWPGRLLFPPVCLGCRDIMADAGSLCASCWRDVRFIERPYCEVLGAPFAHEMYEGAVSPAAMARPPPFGRARASVVYTGTARKLVQALKYNDRIDLAPAMARWMVRAGSELLAADCVLVPVPLHRRRFLARRFNQSAELGRAVAEQTGLDYAPDAVRRLRATRQQVGLKASEREANVRGAFTVRAVKAIRGRHVVIVDDVYTTGATVGAMARALRRSGASGVDVLTFARAIAGDFLPAQADTI